MLRHLRRFLRQERGSVFVVAAVTAIAVIGSVGLAVDVGRSQMAQNKLQNSLDAASLAAGATLSSDDLQSVVTKYLQLNFADGNLGATLTDIEVSLSTDQQVLTTSATATLPTSFMKIFGYTSVTLHASSQITRTNKGMELALVLDTTGSMAGSKLATLQSSAHDLLDILFGNNTTAQNLWVGVVPFTQAVNIGPSRTSWINQTDFAKDNWGPSSWAGCVMARYSTGNDVTDATPGTELFKAYYWADNDSYNNWIQTTTSNKTICSGKSSCSCGSTPNCTCTGSNSNKKCVQTTTATNYVINSTQGPNTYCPSTITPLTNVKADVGTGIDALVANGGTHINLGAVWGWRLLSPKWRGLWGGVMDSNGLPLDYNTPLMTKVAIIMTDGENTMYDYDYTAYGYLTDGNLGTTNDTTADAKLDSKLTAVCNAMKANGILIYTILFEETDPHAISLMQGCATGPDYFFNSPDEATLTSAFHQIGDSLANLRISQ